MEPTLIGTYGQWAGSLMAGRLPRMSFRRTEFTDVDAWRAAARKRLIDLLAAPPVPTPEAVDVVAEGECEGVRFERVRWRLPYGPATDAVVLRPAGATGRLPGVLALHCHGMRKNWGWRKIARIAPPSAMLAEYQTAYYGGRAWANELARRGYVVLVHDCFAFASRSVRMDQCLPGALDGAQPVEFADDDPAATEAYNEWARRHENIMARSLLCAGTTWPGVFWSEDRVALDILARRRDVDPARLGCAGLSGGGLRTCMLAGLDERIRCCAAAGFMSTWRDFCRRKSHTHTWMLYVPLLASELDFPEVIGLRAPAPTMVLCCTEDELFTLADVKDSAAILSEVFAKAGAADRLAFNLYPGGHRFDVPMQEDAFAWFDRWLRSE